MTVGGQQSSLTASRCCGTSLRWSRCSQQSCEKTPGECLPLPLSTPLIPPGWTEGGRRKRKKNPGITFRTLALTSTFYRQPATGEFQQYRIMPGGGVDPRQTGSIQEAAVMQSDADEVGGAVGGRAYKQATVGHKVVNLVGEIPVD